MTTKWSLAIAALVLGAMPLLAQQDAGDKEVGIGGALTHLHRSNSGTAFAQFSLGVFASKQNFFGVDATPMVTYGDGSTSVGGSLNGIYRRFWGENAKVFPFVGGGGGAFFAGGSDGTSAQGTLKGELGLKSYISPKTSLEFAYGLNYLPKSGDGFKNSSFSVFIVSIRHLF